MENTNLLQSLNNQNQINTLISTNKFTAAYGLVLTKEEAADLIQSKNECLKEQERLEFTGGILPKLIYSFCDCVYICQENYAQTLERLQSIFYLYKNETLDILTDDELISYMKQAFEGICHGSLEYLEETALEDFARNIRTYGRKFIEGAEN